MAMMEWIDWYKAILRATAPDPFRLTYRDLVTDATDAIRRIAMWAGNARPGRATRRLDTGTHIIGGSPALRAQYAKRDIRPIKYADAWKIDAPFRRACARAYSRHKKSLEPILKRVGQPNVNALQAELADGYSTRAGVESKNTV